MMRMTAVPLLVNCAVPSRWIAVQEAAAASQKFTTPGFTAEPPDWTAAVSVTTLPEFTIDTPLPPEVTVRVVVVVT